MKKALLFTVNFVLLSLISESVLASCLPGNPRSIYYIRRDNNRCEGVISDFNISSGLDLISFTTVGSNPLSSRVSIQVPRISNKFPKVSIQAIKERYLLNKFSLDRGNLFYFFKWSSFVIKKIPVKLKNLRAIAYFEGNQRVYVPVILKKPSVAYKFVILADRLTRIKTFEILKNGKIIYKNSNKIPTQGEIEFRWNPNNYPSGRYLLHYKGETENFGRPSDPFSVWHTIEHNKNWMR